MGIEIDLLVNYPKTKRNVDDRAQEKTPQDQEIARRFGKDFFDGDRKYGYGGFNYHPRFWQPVVPTFIEHYGLNNSHSLLDVGCAKGFMLYDFQLALPGIKTAGLDISEYAIENALPEMRKVLRVGSVHEMPYESKSFDLVTCITTLHNMDFDGCAQGLKEIERVSKGKSFITVDAYRNEAEKKRMDAWNLTAKTVLHVDDWQNLFHKVGYTGDYYWFIP